MNPINQVVWSFSLLERYEKCPHAAKLRFIDRVPEPKLDDLPAKKGAPSENPAERGIRVHEGCEQFVDGRALDLPVESEVFRDPLTHLRGLHQLGHVQQEKTWLFDREWQEVPSYKQAWGVMKLDVFVHDPEKTTALVIDHKTGKLDNNRVKHAKQGAAYQTLVFHRYPHIMNVIVEFWYHDLGVLTRQSYVRQNAPSHTAILNNAVTCIEQDRHFRPSPATYKCLYCGYRNGVCDYAIHPD